MTTLVERVVTSIAEVPFFAHTDQHRKTIFPQNCFRLECLARVFPLAVIQCLMTAFLPVDNVLILYPYACLLNVYIPLPLGPLKVRSIVQIINKPSFTRMAV